MFQGSFVGKILSIIIVEVYDMAMIAKLAYFFLVVSLIMLKLLQTFIT